MASEETGRSDWKTPRTLKLFLDLCINEVAESRYCGLILKKDSWENVRQGLKEKNLDFSQKLLKNQWDHLKKKYAAWIKVIGKTGNTHYDPITHTINWSSEQGEEHIKINPEAKQFRKHPLQYHEEMTSLFDGIGATSKYAWGPSAEGFLDKQKKDIESPLSVFVETDLDNGPSTHQDDLRPKAKRLKTKKQNHFSNKNQHNELDNQLIAALNSFTKSIETERPTMEECHQILDDMCSILLGDLLYFAACAIFSESKAYREQWMILKDKPEEIRREWIAMIGRKLNAIQN